MSPDAGVTVGDLADAGADYAGEVLRIMRLHEPDFDFGRRAHVVYSRDGGRPVQVRGVGAAWSLMFVEEHGCVCVCEIGRFNRRLISEERGVVADELRANQN